MHKANIMKLADGLFLESCREVATKYPGIKYNEIIVDNCCMQLVSKPEQFDVMVFFLMLSHIIYFSKLLQFNSRQNVFFIVYIRIYVPSGSTLYIFLTVHI